MGSAMCPPMTADVIHVLAANEGRQRAKESLTVASRVNSSIHRITRLGLRYLTFARDAWRLDSVLKDFVTALYEPPRNAGTTAHSFSHEEVESALSDLRDLCDKIDELYISARKKKLTNAKFVGAAFNSIKTRGEELRDVVDWMDAAFDPETDKHFANALRDLESGEVFDLSGSR